MRTTLIGPTATATSTASTTATATARWIVNRLERPSGFATINRSRSGLRVHVGDDGGGLGAASGAGDMSVVTADFDERGGVVVETCSAPPALLVTRRGTQLLPATPGLRRPTLVAPGDLLLLCSASALDAPPVGLVQILKAPAREVLSMSPTVLLGLIMADQTDGAAAIVTRAPVLAA